MGVNVEVSARYSHQWGGESSTARTTGSEFQSSSSNANSRQNTQVSRPLLDDSREHITCANGPAYLLPTTYRTLLSCGTCVPYVSRSVWNLTTLIYDVKLQPC